MTLRFWHDRRFRYQSAAAHSACCWLFFHPGFSWAHGPPDAHDRDYQYARWRARNVERPSPAGRYFTSCGKIRWRIAYRSPASPDLNVLAERAWTFSPSPRSRRSGGRRHVQRLQLSTWELSPPAYARPAALEAPVPAGGMRLGAGLLVGHPALSTVTSAAIPRLVLYCFSPAVIKACIAPILKSLPPSASIAAFTPASAWPMQCRDRAE